MALFSHVLKRHSGGRVLSRGWAMFGQLGAFQPKSTRQLVETMSGNQSTHLQAVVGGIRLSTTQRAIGTKLVIKARDSER